MTAPVRAETSAKMNENTNVTSQVQNPSTESSNGTEKPDNLRDALISLAKLTSEEATQLRGLLGFGQSNGAAKVKAEPKPRPPVRKRRVFGRDLGALSNKQRVYLCWRIDGSSTPEELLQNADASGDDGVEKQTVRNWIKSWNSVANFMKWPAEKYSLDNISNSIVAELTSDLAKEQDPAALILP